MDEQDADLNQPSGIFGEEKKSFGKKISEGFGALLAKISNLLGKLFVKKELDNENSSFVGPMDKNIFTDEQMAAKLSEQKLTENEDLAGMTGAEGKMSEISSEQSETRAVEVRTDTEARTEVRMEDAKAELPEIFYPETTEDLIWLLNKLPETVISSQQKKTMAAAMSFDGKRVKEVMTPKNEVIFIHENDFMGPLTLSRLYQSGLTHFPVTGTKGEVVGLIHTSTLFSLSVKETDRASAFLDKKVYYMSENYTLKEALLAFIRTGCHFFIVVDDFGKVTGLLNFKELISLIVGELPKSDFDQDQDLVAVTKYAREHEMK